MDTTKNTNPSIKEVTVALDGNIDSRSEDNTFKTPAEVQDDSAMEYSETPKAERTRLGSTASSVSNTSKASYGKRRRRDDDVEIDTELNLLGRFENCKSGLEALIDERRMKSSKVTKDLQEKIFLELDEMHKLAQKFALENAALRGKLSERADRPAVTFSSVLQRPASQKSTIPPVTGATRRQVEKRHTLFIKHENREKDKPLERKNIIMLLNPVKEKLKIKTCRNTRNGDIVIEAATAADLAKITESRSLIESGYKIEKPAKRMPKIIIFDIPSEYTEDEVKEAIILQNEDRITDEDKSKITSGLQFRFKNGKREQETSNRVYEVTPELRHVLRRLNHVYIDMRRCKVSDFLTATRCYKCHGLGHTTKYCTSKVDICGHCAAEGHDFKSCPNKAKPKICVTCKRAGKPYQHAMDKNCPEFKAAVEQVRLKTDYG